MREKQPHINTEARLARLIINQMTNSRDKELEYLLGLDSVDWQRFKDYIGYHDLAPFAYLVLKDFDSLLPRGFIEFLKNNYYCTLARCERLWEEFLTISKAFEDNKVFIAPIKGAALLKDIYYDRPIRPMSDMDLFIKEADFPHGRAVLRSLGYKEDLGGLKEEYWKKDQYHISFYKKDESFFVELHWGLDYRRKGIYILPEVWGRTRRLDVDGKGVMLLSPEDTFFCTALHNRRSRRPLCLKDVYDLILLLKKYGTSFDWDYILQQSEKYNICSTAYFLLCQACFIDDIELPKRIFNALMPGRLKRRLILNFIRRNTFWSGSRADSNTLFLKIHFLLYDNFWEPVDYILRIPKEQFAKFYMFKPYSKKTNFLYSNRLLYMPFRAACDFVLTNILTPKIK